MHKFLVITMAETFKSYFKRKNTLGCKYLGILKLKILILERFKASSLCTNGNILDY